MGTLLSKNSEPNPRGSEHATAHESQPSQPLPVAAKVEGMDSFPRPRRDPESTNDSLQFPLDGQALASVSDKQLFAIFSTAPRLHHYGHTTIVRISQSLVIKGGPEIAGSEAQNMIFASQSLGLPVPTVHRTFTASMTNIYGAKRTKANFIVMDYIPGPTVEECWGSAEQSVQESIAQQVADMINKMQSKPCNSYPPGPLGRNREEKFQGPWFTDFGAGPFTTLQDLEAWFNHKIDVCIQVKQVPTNFPRFRFQDVVFTHQDIAPRNMVLDTTGKVWLLDWGCAGMYPRGFEQAALREQSWNDEFLELVLARLLDRQEEIAEQYAGIAYGLSTGRHL